MKYLNLIKIAIATLVLTSNAVWAQAPHKVYGAPPLSITGPAALATTTGTPDNPRSNYVVAAGGDSGGALEVTAWQDTRHEISLLGSADSAGSPECAVGAAGISCAAVCAVAATGLDPSHVVTATVDVSGALSLATWTVGGEAGIAFLNGATTSPSTAYNLCFPPFVGVAAMSPTTVVTAFVDWQQNLVVEAWTVSATSSTAPVQTGVIGGGDGVVAAGAPQTSQVTIAQLDASTVVTAVTNSNQQLTISTWGVDSGGVHLQHSFTTGAGFVVGAANSGLALAAGSEFTLTARIPFVEETRTAFTTILPQSDVLEVEGIYWNISPSGEISMGSTRSADVMFSASTAVAACMLPGILPISAYEFQTVGPNSYYDIDVSVLGGPSTESQEISVNAGSILTLSAAYAGTDLSLRNVIDPFADYEAYFVTGVLTEAPSGAEQFTIQVWARPIAPPAFSVSF
jgi:hypothetical protein